MLYERAELPDGVHQAALEKLLATGYVVCPRAGDLVRTIRHLGSYNVVIY